MHKPIQLKDISLSFPNKLCLDNVSLTIRPGDKIALIGRNGQGKSSLLKMLYGQLQPTTGEIKKDPDGIIGYVPQLINDVDGLSGGQKFNKKLTEALAIQPDILLLDEPTNNLDAHNRRSLMRMLNNFDGTLIVVTHDVELLRNCTNTLWHFNNQTVQLFSGNYDDYISKIQQEKNTLDNQLSTLKKQKKDSHKDLMKEQKRASQSKKRGLKSKKEAKWSPAAAGVKQMGAENASGRKQGEINKKSAELQEQLSHLYVEEEILPTFSLPAGTSNKTVLSITQGTVGYEKRNSLVSGISFTLKAGQRAVLSGNNGSGKSTLIKALLGNESVIKTGDWFVVNLENIGYLDQNYGTLTERKTVFETIKDEVPEWDDKKIRSHLNDFLFRKTEEVQKTVKILSGGEKVRLCLAQIAAKTPELLLLDEITNNIDLETRNHVTQVLKEYPGALLIISHDQDFLDQINVQDYYQIKDGIFSLV